MQVRAMGKKILLCILTVLSIFTVGCTKTDNRDTVASEKAEKRDKKESDSEEKSEKKEKDKGGSKKTVEISKMPHILLEGIEEEHYSIETGEFMYSLRNVRLGLREDDEEFDPLRKAFENLNRRILI